ncbi:hypothetical protein R69888_03573 [Paraburkholderia haematera]|uniref:Uncharacterized protein n=1 Tax=Paraburkholderia haematera TaxID=2793077 RepID=A0ABM8RPI3_9BURK|nr:hypothetical protein R69888_03573 [Paraburkholderia haematera]
MIQMYLVTLFSHPDRHGFMTVSIAKERVILTIPTIGYQRYELHAYSRQVFRDPYANGPRPFSSIVRIDNIPSTEVKALRQAALFDTVSPTTAGDAIDLAMQYGKDIVDGKVPAAGLRHAECQSVPSSSGAGHAISALCSPRRRYRLSCQFSRFSPSGCAWPFV